MSSVFQTESRFYKVLLLFFLGAKAALMIVLIAYSYLHLAPDEAQYWTWSQKLDWGYYSKPPAIAWQIWLITSLFGNSELGVRFGAILIGFFLPCILYLIARQSNLTPKISFWAAIVLAFSPLGIYLSLAATTDGGMILGLLLATFATIRGFHEESGPNYLLVGLAVFLGALYKWTAFIFWPFLIFFLFLYPRLRKKQLILGVAISLLALIPVVYWNIRHDFATFRHVFNTVYQPTGKTSGNFFDFLGAQIALLSPIYFLLLIWSCFYLKRKENFGLIFCASFPCAALLFLIIALFKKMQPNWAAYLYPPGMVLVAWGAFKHIKGGKVWLYFGTALSVFAVLFALTIPLFESRGLMPRFPIPYRANPFRQNMGWSRLADALKEADYNPDRDFLFADKYQAASLLSFYAPEQKSAYFFNLNRQRKNQFSYWKRMEDQEKGKDGYFVVIENVKGSALPWYDQHYRQRLSPYFKQVVYLGGYPLFTAYGEPVKYAIVFKCVDYSGDAPIDPEQY